MDRSSAYRKLLVVGWTGWSFVYLNNRGARTLPCWRPFFCMCHLLRLPTSSTPKTLFDSMVWISYVSLTPCPCVMSKTFLAYPSSMNCVRFMSWLVLDFPALKPARSKMRCSSTKTTVLLPRHSVLWHCWQEGAAPQDITDYKVITAYENKSERNDCNTYKGISLLSIVDKVRICSGHTGPPPEAGFRAERSTVDMVFSLRQLHEKFRNQQMPLYITYIDYGVWSGQQRRPL